MFLTQKYSASNPSLDSKLLYLIFKQEESGKSLSYANGVCVSVFVYGSVNAQYAFQAFLRDNESGNQPKVGSFNKTVYFFLPEFKSTEVLLILRKSTARTTYKLNEPLVTNEKIIIVVEVVVVVIVKVKYIQRIYNYNCYFKLSRV